MDIIHGFQLLEERWIAEMRIRAQRLAHRSTGARLLSLSAEDENKVFGVSFRTPPPDSTGVAHILEHAVLCGSRKYPVKEPFVELLKGSLQTFLNAMTYPDKTCYPVASQNLRDFYNLVDVYLDAVFYPRLTPEVFGQEGWHYEVEQTSGRLEYRGVVFNEMKGALSSPDQLLGEYVIQSLFPDHPYAFVSGGHPREIPTLTFERFLQFHRRYYHPSNAFFWFYGDDEPTERLRVLDSYLKEFDPQPVASAVPEPGILQGPLRLRRPYMAGDTSSAVEKAMATVNWRLVETCEARDNFAHRILAHILLGMPASPLRKALIDSGLGEDLAGEGLGTELRHLYLSTGLKGVPLPRVDQVEDLVVETLRRLVRDGLDPLTVQAALNTVEFRLRENNTGRFPRGLALMLRALTTWLYEADPFALLAFETPLREIQEALAADRRFFERLMDANLLSNPQRTTLVLEPDPELRQKEETAEKKSLLEARAAMDEERLGDVLETVRRLKRWQETPDSPQALDTIPVLKIEDLDRRNKAIPQETMRMQGVPILLHDLFANGIVYLDVGFNLRSLPEELLPLVPLFGRALLEMGTAREDFVSLDQRINRETGGITRQTFTSARKEGPKGAAWLFLRGKAMASKGTSLIDILRDVLLGARLDDPQRFRQIVLEEKARCEQNLIPRGHLLVDLRLRSHFGDVHWAAETMAGVSHLFALRELAQRVEAEWENVRSSLEEVRRRLINTQAMVLNVTGEARHWKALEGPLAALLGDLPAAPWQEASWHPPQEAKGEALIVPSQVNFVGTAADLTAAGFRFHGAALVVTRYLRNTWLWDQVRVRGGAYGAFCLLDRFSGVLTFVSYRDPHLLETLEVFSGAAAFLARKPLPRRELLKSIIGAIGALDAHLLPDAKGYTALLRHLTGETEAARQQMREEILATEAEDFARFARFLEQADLRRLVKVLGPDGTLDRARALGPGGLKPVRLL